MRIKTIEVQNQKFLFDGNGLKIYETDNFDQFNAKYFLTAEAPRSLQTEYVRTVCLVLNNSCNLTCSYCYANKGVYDFPNEQMTLESAKEIIDPLMKLVSNNGGVELTVAFFGGEPLLSMKLITAIVDYMETSRGYLKCNYKITTNGTLLSQDNVDFMENHNFEVMISLDGDKKRHDTHRIFVNGKGSYDRVAKNITLFKNKNKLNARITVTNSNVDIYSYFNGILDLGFNRLTYALDSRISPEDFSIFAGSLRAMLSQYISDIRNCRYYEITNLSLALVPLLTSRGYMSHCNAGTSYITKSADGTIYKCPRFIGDNNYLYRFDKINIIHKEDRDRGIEIEVKDRNLLACETCEYLYICGGVCSFHSKKGGNVAYECQHRKILFEKTLELICSLTKSQRRQFILYLNSVWTELR